MRIEKVKKEKKEVEENEVVEVVITETRIDPAGKEYEYSWKESIDVTELDRQIASHQSEIDKLQEKKDVVMR